MTEQSSTSDFFLPDDESPSAVFTELTPLPARGCCGLTKAKRYGRWWMLKYLKPEQAGQKMYQNLLRKEFELMVSLQHPNIVTTAGWEQVEGLGNCIVMEWIDGENLRQWMGKQHSKGDRRRVALQLMDALCYIHGLQLAHRDLKPSNIMITRNGGNVKLIDFGLSDTDSFAIFKQQAGTVGYMDPAANSTSAMLSDIYSLGCVLADLRLGWRYRPIVNKCCARPQKRYQHVAAVRKAFVRSERMPRIFVAVALITLILCLSFTLISTNSQRLDNAISQTKADNAIELKAMRQQQANQKASDKRVQDSLQARIRQLEDDADKADKAAKQKAAYIKKGVEIIDSYCRSFDRKMKRQSVEALSHSPEKLTQLSAEMNDIDLRLPSKINNYVKGLNLKEDEKTNLWSVLEKYYSDHYLVPWLRSIEDANAKLSAADNS